MLAEGTTQGIEAAWPPLLRGLLEDIPGPWPHPPNPPIPLELIEPDSEGQEAGGPRPSPCPVLRPASAALREDGPPQPASSSVMTAPASCQGKVWGT